MKNPNPRVELSYMYLMAWYVMHCPSLMTAVSPSEGFITFVQRLENSSWSQYYMYYVRKAILISSSYQLDRCFSEISGASYGDKFVDLAGPDDFTRLLSEVFWWLINIRSGYLIFRQGDSCTIESYMPSYVLGSSAMINYMLATPTLASTSVVTYLKVPERGITV